MATRFLPGSVLTQSGFYLVSHSNGHMPDASTHLMEGLVLPGCGHDGCCGVYYVLLKATTHLLDDDDSNG
jgi:hypothetical protein